MIEIDFLVVLDFEDSLVANSSGKSTKEILVHFGQVLSAFNKKLLLRFAVRTDCCSCSSSEKRVYTDYQAILHDFCVFFTERNG